MSEVAQLRLVSTDPQGTPHTMREALDRVLADPANAEAHMRDFLAQQVTVSNFRQETPGQLWARLYPHPDMFTRDILAAKARHKADGA